MSEGTPIDAIESGEVADAADSQHMQAILADMNASGAAIANGPGMPQHQQHSQGQQPMMPMRPQHPQMYNPNPAPMQQRHYVDEPTPRKRSVGTSILDRVIDPVMVAILIFVLSLPVLHTYGARYASWAFAIGGQLSWLGLIALSLVGGALFGIYRTSRDILGL